MRRTVEHEDEFLAAIARGEIERPLGRPSYTPCDSLQTVIACLMSVDIIEDLKVVDIDQNDLQWHIFTL
jgi:hypothetical protein